MDILTDQTRQTIKSVLKTRTPLQKVANRTSTNCIDSCTSAYDEEHLMTQRLHFLSDSSSEDDTSRHENVSRRSSQSTPIVSLKDLKLDIPKKRHHTLLDDDDGLANSALLEKKDNALVGPEKMTGNLPFSSSSDEHDSESDSDSSSPIFSALYDLASDAKLARSQGSATKPLVSSTKKTGEPRYPTESMDVSTRLPSHHLKEKADKVTMPANRSVSSPNGLVLGLNEIKHKQDGLLYKKLSFSANGEFSPLSRPLSEMELDALSQGTEKIEELLNDESWW